MSELPDITRYLDYRAFLADWFQARQAANPRYSHRQFLRAAGQKSPSLLLAVLRGQRNLTPATQEGFLRALKLSPADAEWFVDLVALGQATSDAARNEAWRSLSARKRFREAYRVEGDGFRYLSDWWLPALRELAATADFRDDPAWIARRLRPALPVAVVSAALHTLVDLGLLVRSDDHRWVPADASIVTPREVTGLAVHNYHRGMIRLAEAAIEAAHPTERHLLGVTVAIPRSLLPRLKEELNAFQARLLDLCDAHPEAKQEVVQLNLQLFPLTQPSEAP